MSVSRQTSTTGLFELAPVTGRKRSNKNKNQRVVPAHQQNDDTQTDRLGRLSECSSR